MNPQQPPYGQQGQHGQQPPYQGYGQQQPPYGQQPGYNHGQQQQPPPPGQYGAPPQGQYPPTSQYPPQGQHPGASQYPPQGQQPGGYPGYSQQPPPGQQPYGQQPPYGQQAPYGQQPPPGQQPQYGQQPPYGQYPPQGYGAPPPGQQQWQHPPPGQGPYGYQQPPAPPAPASLGYDLAQKQFVQPVDTSFDVESLRKAMKGMGCDEKAIIKVVTNSKYANPWAMQQLVLDYNKRFIRDLLKDIESETRGDLETGLLAIMRGPLLNEVKSLHKALDRAGTDEDILMDVLLCRSNADVRAIAAEYRHITGRDLLNDIKDDVNDDLFRLYSMVLAATRAEAQAPVNPADIDHKITEIHRATEGTIGANAVAVAQAFTSSNDAQIHAMVEAYQRKYHRNLEDVIEKEFRGDMEDALLRMVSYADARAKFDAKGVYQILQKTIRKDTVLINRVLTLFYDKPRLDAAKVAYKKSYGRSMGGHFKDYLSGDYETFMIALVGKD